MPDDLPDLLADADEGFADLCFRVTDWTHTIEGELAVTVKALSNGHHVGVKIVVGKDWKPATVGENIPVFWGTVSYISTGLESDRLLQAIASAYGLPDESLTMNRQIQFPAVALKGNPMNCIGEAVHMKLFYESKSEGHYAEVFTNIDLYGQSAQIREKDPEYRRPLLAAIARTE